MDGTDHDFVCMCERFHPTRLPQFLFSDSVKSYSWLPLRLDAYGKQNISKYLKSCHPTQNLVFLRYNLGSNRINM